MCSAARCGVVHVCMWSGAFVCHAVLCCAVCARGALVRMPIHVRVLCRVGYALSVCCAMHVLCHAVPCCAVCCIVMCHAVPCCAVPGRAVLCLAVQCSAVSCSAVRCHACVMRCCAVLYIATHMLCCAMHVLWCAMSTADIHTTDIAANHH